MTEKEVAGGVGWIHLAHDRLQLRDAVNTVLNYRVPYGQGIF